MEHSKLPELEAIIVDTDHAFIVRIGTVPRSTQTGIANIIPQGIDRKSRDAVIEWARFIVQACNSLEAMKEALDEWNLFDAEAGDLHPCPDYTLRAHYKERARNKTKIALSLANKTGE